MKVGQLHLNRVHTTNWHKQSHQLQLWSHPQRCTEQWCNVQPALSQLLQLTALPSHLPEDVL